MAEFQVRTATAQVADHLRREIERRRWTQELPGGTRLAKELGVGKSTIEAALALLDAEGLLLPQGTGRPRRIDSAKLRGCLGTVVRLLLYERDDVFDQVIFELRRQLESAGHELVFASKTMRELHHDPRRVARMVGGEPANAWIVLAGSRPVLEWFAGAGMPVLALFGQPQGLPLASTGPDKLPALRDVLQRLMDRGHRRIVMLAREERRKPQHGLFEQAFFDELKARGLAAGAYNLPDWEESAAGLNRCLDGLFQVTPPTAIIIQDSMLSFGVKSYLARQRGLALRQVVLVCADYHPTFEWCDPPMPHFSWDPQVSVRRVVRWVDHVSQGKNDLRQQLVAAKFIEGELPGPE